MEGKSKTKYGLLIVSTEEDLLKTVHAAGQNVSLENIKNKNENSPEWYPEYETLYEEAKKLVDDNIADNL